MKSKPNHPWDIACSMTVERSSPSNSLAYPLAPIDPGVNFFVLALEELGAVPHYSCEGHPTGFYIAFEAPYELALEIHGAAHAIFDVEVWKKQMWTLRKTRSERPIDGEYSEEDKQRQLRSAATGWLHTFRKRLAGLQIKLAVQQRINGT